MNFIMIESIVLFIQSLPPEGVLITALLLTCIENIFPPSPSDFLLVFCGTLIGFGTVSFIPLLISSTIGSIIGFAIMFKIGAKIGLAIDKKPKLWFIPHEAIEKAEAWFRTYGYVLIIANRFLSGTRAVISFVAGASAMNFVYSIILSALSALIWNGILIYAGMELGNNWRLVSEYLSTYSSAIAPILVICLIIGILIWQIKKRNNSLRSK